MYFRSTYNVPTFPRHYLPKSAHKNSKRKSSAGGFEPPHPKILDFKSSALDHSAILTNSVLEVPGSWAIIDKVLGTGEASDTIQASKGILRALKAILKHDGAQYTRNILIEHQKREKVARWDMFRFNIFWLLVVHIACIWACIFRRKLQTYGDIILRYKLSFILKWA